MAKKRNLGNHPAKIDPGLHHKIQEQLDQLQIEHELILNAAGEGIYGLDCQGHTTFVNEAASRMVGWKLSELIGKSQHSIIHHTKQDGSIYEAKTCPIYAAFSDGKVHYEDNEVFWRKDGSCFPVEYVSTPMKDPQGNIIGAVVVFRDITGRRQAQAALKASHDDLAEALQEVRVLKARLEEENQYLQQEIKITHNFEEIISQSARFKKVLRQVEQVAATDATVLIQGESGTGKELIARALHNLSPRKPRALVKVNCAALPATLIESELFGHERGAFTGAINQKVGRFELSDEGTIFLDEIGEIPLELQSKLLRVLQEGEFERLGSTKTTQVNVRVIAATNRTLEDAVEEGSFREDLYYRLNVFPLELPPLRERKEDIPLLVHHFMLKYGSRFGKDIKSVSKKHMEALVGYHWPGNIRELENIIERGVITAAGSKLDLMLPKLKAGMSQVKRIVSLEDNERDHILKALEATHWRVSGEKGAAKLLDIKRTTLEARMKKLGIEKP